MIILFQRPQWYPLLSTKYQRLKPEVKLLLSLEDDTAQSAPHPQEEPQQEENGMCSHQYCCHWELDETQIIINI